MATYERLGMDWFSGYWLLNCSVVKKLKFVLLEDFNIFIRDHFITIKRGFCWDGDSYSLDVWPYVACCVHDYLCITNKYPIRESNKIYRDLLCETQNCTRGWIRWAVLTLYWSFNELQPDDISKYMLPEEKLEGIQKWKYSVTRPNKIDIDFIFGNIPSN